MIFLKQQEKIQAPPKKELFYLAYQEMARKQWVQHYKTKLQGIIIQDNCLL
jgi:superfamily II DNA or RNA helicase